MPIKLSNHALPGILLRPCRRVVECGEGPARSDDTADGSDGRGTDNLVSDFGAGGVSVSNPSLFFDGYTAIIADDPEHLFMGGIDQALGTSDFPVAVRKATQVKERTRTY